MGRRPTVVHAGGTPALPGANQSAPAPSRDRAPQSKRPGRSHRQVRRPRGIRDRSLRRLSHPVPHQAGEDRRLRSLRQRERRAGAHRPAGADPARAGRGRTGGALCGRGAGRLGRQGLHQRSHLRYRHRFGHHLSRLQAGAVHRRRRVRGRRHGDRRLRRHLFVLRREGKDRHRPLSRTGVRGHPRGGASRSGTSPSPSTARRCSRSEA